MDVMMRGAVQLQAFDTATLLARCVGPWSGPAMDLLLVLYGNGALVAYFILLGDFLPAIVTDLVQMSVISPPQLSAQDLRTRCILSTLIVVVPLSIPRKLSALRYASPIALISILYFSTTVLTNAPELILAHLGQPEYGEIQWFNVVGGYLSFLAVTDQNILRNYGTSGAVTLCRILLSFTILVGIPTNLLPTVRSFKGFIENLTGAAKTPPMEAPLLPTESTTNGAGDTATTSSEVFRLLLTAFCLAAEVVVAIAVPNVADVMGFLGASVGTILMMVLPLTVLVKARPKDYSTARVWLTGLLLLTSSLTAFTALVVM
eukprot:CAMPEP_0177411388 /NCGR_PEP_ID=MMETSP0368-20130122/65384_1 /TAXON_ID=447022 ORGANISM="Scrippsiella hangoei-like, Strain SHHI-4" /NCGR_SAMPLE_ID=MMETSP0368 /ASSEMBLY_ACC=CAM_ASM_000363 /LENGTH=317 /DNA_ID=CAMNT_0018880487 /DNA_START=1 /DNA_END=955 /DNA_ORIENTATION=-